MMMTKTLAILTTLAAIAIAAPFTPTQPIQDANAKVRDAPPSTCTDGVPASQQHPKFPINDFTHVVPTANLTSYSIKQDWYETHFVSGPHYIAAPIGSDPYGAFKCQYTCNGAGNCNSFFVWHEKSGTGDDHLNCVLFDAVMDPSVFEELSDASVVGASGYDRICQVLE